MAFQDFKMQILNAAFNLAGTVITQTMSGGVDKYEELQTEHYKKMSKIVEKAQQERKYDVIETKEEPVVEYVAMPKKDLSITKIEKGTACLACIPPDSLIVSNPNVKEIRDVQRTEMILDKSGEYTEVVDVMQRKYTGDILNIYTKYNLPITITPNHSVLSITAEPCPFKQGYCLPGKDNPKCKTCMSVKEYEAEMMPAGALVTTKWKSNYTEPKQYLLSPRIKKVEDVEEIKLQGYTIKVDNDFMKLIGWYLAEGSLLHFNRGGGVSFSFGKHESKYANEVKILLEKIFNSKVKIREKETALSVETYSKKISEVFKNFGERATDKKIPKWILFLPREKQVTLLEGYFRGDGYRKKAGIKKPRSDGFKRTERYNAFSCSSVSRNLIFSLRLILNRLGIVSGIGCYKNSTSVINGRIIQPRHKVYTLNIGGISAKNLAEYMKYPVCENPFRESHAVGMDNNYIYYPIKKIEKIPYDDVVMNLGTRSHTYTVAGICVSNCSKDHFSTASGALSEALRFARKDGINNPEVQTRLGIATDELNIMERIDLSAEKIIHLDGHEKQLALSALNESRDLRHEIMAVQTPDDLEKAAAEAARIRTHFMKSVFSMAMRDGTVDKLCRNFTGEEKSKCMKTLTAILEEKKESEMK